MQVVMVVLKYDFVIMSKEIERVTNKEDFRLVYSEESFSKVESQVDLKEAYQQRSRKIQRIKEEYHQGFGMCS